MRFSARISALVVTATIGATALTACAASEATCVNPLGDGIASSVSATGPLGSAPTIDFPLPLVGKDSSTATISTGDGDLIRDGNYVDFEATVLNGADKTVLTATTYGANGSSAQRIGIQVGNNVLADSFLCHRVGERFALVGTIGDIFGATGGNGVDPTATAVVVFDVLAAYPHTAQGETQLGTDGLPAVTSAPDGRPGIAIPNWAPPTELRVGTLIKGGGAVVAQGDALVIHDLGVTWGKSVFENTWDTDHPKTILVQSAVDNGGVGVVPGLAQALVGQTIGSRVVVVVPAALGYPDGTQPQEIPAGSVLVYVVDILGAQQ